MRKVIFSVTVSFSCGADDKKNNRRVCKNPFCNQNGKADEVRKKIVRKKNPFLDDHKEGDDDE